MSDNTEGWFDEGLREGAPSAKFAEVGDKVVGELIDKYTIDYVPFGKTEVAKDEKTGEPIKQLVLVLQTDQRNWEGVSKVPTSEDGTKKDPKLDDGKRAVYARKFTNIYGAIAAGIKAAGVDKPAKHPALGGKLGIQFFEEEDTGKGNPLKKFRAKYEPPAEQNEADSFMDGASEAEAEEKPAESKKTTVVDEPPF